MDGDERSAGPLVQMRGERRRTAHESGFIGRGGVSGREMRRVHGRVCVCVRGACAGAVSAMRLDATRRDSIRCGWIKYDVCAPVVGGLTVPCHAVFRDSHSLTHWTSFSSHMSTNLTYLCIR